MGARFGGRGECIAPGEGRERGAGGRGRAWQPTGTIADERLTTVNTLETSRLRLRPLVDADIDAYAAMCADAEVMRYLGDSGPLSREDAWRQMAMLVGHWQLRGFGMWAVEERTHSGLLIGRIGLHQPEGWPGLEVGWALARAYWGLGYATEAARVSVEHAFANLDHDRVISLIAPENARSIRVAERLGARATGSWRHRGRDLQVYAIDRARWTAGMRNEDGGIRRGRGAGRGDLRGAAGVPPPSGYRSTSDG
jgi:RimJ/RimL family protein N-acetyltransferase